jgi:hypothetical protein
MGAQTPPEDRSVPVDDDILDDEAAADADGGVDPFGFIKARIHRQERIDAGTEPSDPYRGVFGA